MLKIFWGSEYKKGEGNAYGYYVHNTTLKREFSHLVEMVDSPEKADAIIYITSPEYFPGKLHDIPTFLFTMFEGTTLPVPYVESISKADALLSPSDWVSELFVRHFPDVPVYTIPHGVDPVFSFRERRFPRRGKKFRFLWVGAANPRKGWEEVINTWGRTDFAKSSELELYIKTTKIDGVQSQGNVILDGRNLSIDDLVSLYHSAHCFLFPSRGEGFGLTAAEAMRTGLPCIATNYSGHTMFMDDSVAYMIGCRMGKGEVKFIGDGHTEETEIAYPHVDELYAAMIYVYTHYRKAAKKGVLASNRIRREYTWNKSATRLLEAVEQQVTGRVGNGPVHRSGD